MTDYRSWIYDKYASGFQMLPPVFDSAAATRWGRAYAYYLRGYLPQRQDAAIVDVGCGGGRLLHLFKQRGYTHLSGADISPEQVHLARQVVPNIFEGSALEFLAAHRGAFDLIAALDVLEHLRKEEVIGFLEGCGAALKPGGRLVLQTPNAESPFGHGVRYGDFTHEVCFTPDCLVRLLQMCGFSGVEARELGPVPWGYGLASSLRFLAWQVLRLGLFLYNTIETGNGGSGVFSRVFMVSARKAPNS